MIVIPSFKVGIYAAAIGGGGPPPTTKATVYVFNLFWDTEMIVNRYDTNSTTTETTGRGWFFR
jgi:hypothetical protein